MLNKSWTCPVVKLTARNIGYILILNPFGHLGSKNAASGLYIIQSFHYVPDYLTDRTEALGLNSSADKQAANRLPSVGSLICPLHPRFVL